MNEPLPCSVLSCFLACLAWADKNNTDNRKTAQENLKTILSVRTNETTEL